MPALRAAAAAHLVASRGIPVDPDGEITLEQPGEDADLELRHGDFVVQNGGMHKWVNRSRRNAVLALVLATTTRAG